MHQPTVWALGAFCLALASPASAVTLIANFDGFSEGDSSSVVVDGGITFSDLDIRVGDGPGGPFTVDEADASFAPLYSPANVLSPAGYIPGPGAGFGRFGSARITFGSVPGLAATLDIFSLSEPNVLTLEAWLAGSPVASDTIDFVGAGILQQTLVVSGVQFDELRLVASGPVDDGVAFISLDNATVTLVPEPGTGLLLGFGLLGAASLRASRCRLRERRARPGSRSPASSAPAGRGSGAAR